MTACRKTCHEPSPQRPRHTATSPQPTACSQPGAGPWPPPLRPPGPSPRRACAPSSAGPGAQTTSRLSQPSLAKRAWSPCSGCRTARHRPRSRRPRTRHPSRSWTAIWGPAWPSGSPAPPTQHTALQPAFYTSTTVFDTACSAVAGSSSSTAGWPTGHAPATGASAAAPSRYALARLTPAPHSGSAPSKAQPWALLIRATCPTQPVNNQGITRLRPRDATCRDTTRQRPTPVDGSSRTQLAAW